MHRLIPCVALIATLVTAVPAQAESVVLGPVQSTDTLWKLATQVRPDEGVAMVQVVYALWQANPDAFSGQNINMLRAGAQLEQFAGQVCGGAIAARCKTHCGGRVFAFLHSAQGVGHGSIAALAAMVDVPDLGVCGAGALQP